MNEKSIFLKYYRRANGKVIALTKTSYIELDSFENVNFEEDLIQFEKPDMYIALSNKIVLLEHFKVGSSKLIKRSDTKFRNIAEIDRDLQIKLSLSKEGFVSDRRELKNEPSIKNYIENLLYQVGKHNNQYDNYITNYNNKYGKNEYDFGVVIENSSALYDIVEIDGIKGYFTPFNIKEFRSYLSKNKNIKHVFYLYFDGQEHKIYYFCNTFTSLDELNSYISTVTIDDKLLDSNVQVISAVASIDIEK